MKFPVLLFLASLAAAPSSAFFVADGSRPITNRRQLGLDRIYPKTSSSTKLDLYTGASLVNNRHSASDWLYNIQSLPHSEVLREVRSPVLAVAAFSTVVSLVHKLVGDTICIPGTAHSFLVSALGLLLVFRTNSAYQRFNEGRKIWENILSVSRNLSRLVTLYRNDVGAKRHEQIIKLTAAYPYLLRHHVRSGYSRQKGCLCESNPDSISPEHRLRLAEPLFSAETRFESRHQVIEKEDSEPKKCFVDKRNLPWSLFTPKSLKRVAWTQNRPLWVCDRLGELVMDIPYNPNFTSRERLTLLGNIDKLSNAIGECERIHQTAVPLNYARHSLRSLTLWLFTLPFCLVKDVGLLSGPVAACIAWVLFGVYQIGYSIEDPFQGSLRLSILCDSIRKDVMGVLDESKSQRRSAYATSKWIDLDDERNEEHPEIHRAEIKVPSVTAAKFLNDILPEDDKLVHPPIFVPASNGTWNVVMAKSKS